MGLELQGRFNVVSTVCALGKTRASFSGLRLPHARIGDSHMGKTKLNHLVHRPVLWSHPGVKEKFSLGFCISFDAPIGIPQLWRYFSSIFIFPIYSSLLYCMIAGYNGKTPSTDVLISNLLIPQIAPGVMARRNKRLSYGI